MQTVVVLSRVTNKRIEKKKIPQYQTVTIIKRICWPPFPLKGGRGFKALYTMTINVKGGGWDNRIMGDENVYNA